ncbi:MAG: DUF4390 domain-containing protein [Acidobacteriota bacterium]
MSVRRAGKLAVLVLLGIAVQVLASGPYLSGLTAQFKNQKVVVSFGVGNAFDRQDLKEAIKSTRPVTITITVELIRHRLLWKDKVVARKIIHRTITYDNLTHQYRIVTLIKDKKVDEHVVGGWEDMRQYAGHVHDIELTSVANLKPGEGQYSVRARVTLISSFILWIIPWDVETPWVSQELKTP